jgi:chemotaxis methyl-accepting protein methylase
MLKFGVHRPEQLNRRKLDSFAGRRQFLALDLYHRVPEGPEADYFQERILSRLAVANGTFKYTRAHRFDTFDRLSLEEIRKQFQSDTLRVHDIGVSDGRTAAHFFEVLTDVYAELDFTASDLSHCFHVVRRRGGSWRVITDDRGNLIQVVAPPFVFNVARQESKLLYPLNHMVRRVVTALYAQRLLRDPGVARETIEIICASCRAALETGKFHFKSYDLLAGPKGAFDVIRAMNLLNLSYFSEPDFRRIFANIKESLIEGGLFIAGSNEESGSEVNGAIYRKQAGRLIKLAQSGSGLAAEPLMALGS